MRSFDFHTAAPLDATLVQRDFRGRLFDGGVTDLFNRRSAAPEYRPKRRANATDTALRIRTRGGSLGSLRLAMTLRALAATAACVLSAASMPSLTSRASAQLSVRVRAESRIELRTEREAGRVIVIGVLRDDLGEQLADREVTLHAQSTDGVRGERRTVRTDETGQLRAEFALPVGAYRLGATFAGDADHERVEVERALDLDRADVRLRVNVPAHGRLRLDVPEHVIDILAESAAGGAGLRVELADELGRTLGTGTTDPEGRLRFVVRSDQLGPPAAGRLVARGAADALRADAQTEVPVVRVSPTRLILALAHSRVQVGEQLRAHGRLTDHAGRPLPREAVGLFDRSEHLATVLTDESGAFDVRVEATHEGVRELVARYDSDAPWRESSASTVVRVEVASTSGRPLGWLFGTMGLTALALLWLGSRGRKRPALAPPQGPTPRSAGVVAGQRRGRADRADLGGTVLDVRDDEPVAGARVSISRGGAADSFRATESAQAGSFALEDLPPGAYELRIEAAGYSHCAHSLVIPHRGEWSAIRVRLDSLRDRALDAVVPVAAEYLPQRALETATPREVLERARAHGAVPTGLPDLTARAERAAYAAAPPTATDVEATERARDAVLEALQAAKPKSDARR